MERIQIFFFFLAIFQIQSSVTQVEDAESFISEQYR
jgi:hypothetical protein